MPQNPPDPNPHIARRRQPVIAELSFNLEELGERKLLQMVLGADENILKRLQAFESRQGQPEIFGEFGVLDDDISNGSQLGWHEDV